MMDFQYCCIAILVMWVLISVSILLINAVGMKQTPPQVRYPEHLGYYPDGEPVVNFDVQQEEVHD